MKTPQHTPRPGRSQYALSAARHQPALQHGVRAVWLAGVGCWALIATPSLVHAGPAAQPAPTAPGMVQVKVNARMEDFGAQVVPYSLPLGGRPLKFEQPKDFKFHVEDGATAIQAVASDDMLVLTPQHIGRATIVVDAPVAARKTYLVRVVAPAAGGTAAPTTTAATGVTVTSVTVTPGTMMAAADTRASTTNGSVTDNTLSGSTTTSDTSVGATTATASTTNNTVTTSGVPTTTLVSPPVTAPTLPSDLDAVRVSPSVQTPPRLPSGRAPYPTTRGAVPAAARAAAAQKSKNNSISVQQGLAKLVYFPSNILAVFFSDVNVVDARAVNARTVALTGLGSGNSTLAVFSERYPGDAVGKANVYQITVRPQGGQQLPGRIEDPDVVASTIRTALDDPRIGVSVMQSPNGSLVAKLSGVVRDQAEMDAARSIASLYVPNVITSLYVDKNAPALGEAAPLSTQAQLQQSLRQISGNETVELVTLPNGLTLRAVVGSPQEAQALLRLVPLATNQKVVPFITIHNTNSTTGEAFDDIYDGPVLTAEDEDMTRRLHEVTGVNSVYVVRTAQNGVAVYGTVRNRREYDAVRQYTIVLPQVDKGAGNVGGIGNASAPAATSTTNGAGGTGQSGTAGTPLARGAGVTEMLETPLHNVNLPSAGDRLSGGLQWFVRFLDPRDALARVVTAETSIVEISRTSLKNLGVEYGSAQLLSESITGGQTTSNVVGGVLSTVTTPLTVTRTIDPTFRAGIIGGGNGFAGFGNNGLIDPVRVQLNALYQNGNVHVLSNPSLMALDGTSAQIVIGGSRPIPTAAVVGGSGGSTGVQTIDFRKYGIILTMRPTLTDDDTIILQIRADVTNIDPTTAITVNGATIPGETVRSVDTTLTVKEGDVIVMGGLMTNERNARTSRLPVFSSIPILGNLFKSKRFENNQTELAIFFTPRIKRVPMGPTGINDITYAQDLPPLPGVESRGSIFAGSAGGQ